LVLVCSGSVYWLVCVAGRYAVVWCVVGVGVVCSGLAYWLVCCRPVCCCLVCPLVCNIWCVVLCLFGLSGCLCLFSAICVGLVVFDLLAVVCWLCCVLCVLRVFFSAKVRNDGLKKKMHTHYLPRLSTLLVSLQTWSHDTKITMLVSAHSVALTVVCFSTLSHSSINLTTRFSDLVGVRACVQGR
jgi:hypothetical protein